MNIPHPNFIPAVLAALQNLDQAQSQQKAGTMKSIPFTMIRERCLATALDGMARSCGITLKLPLQINAKGDFLIVAERDCLDGEPFSHWLSTVQRRSGLLPAFGVTLHKNDWSYVNQSDIEQLVRAFGATAQPTTQDLAASQVLDEPSPGERLVQQALALLQQAKELDGARPYLISHEHEFGTTLMVRWFDQPPTQSDVENVLQSPFEPDRDEVLTYEAVGLNELLGLDAALVPAPSTKASAAPQRPRI